MIFGQGLMLRTPHLRVHWFSSRLLYLKTLIKIFRLISRLKMSFPYTKPKSTERPLRSENNPLAVEMDNKSFVSFLNKLNSAPPEFHSGRDGVFTVEDRNSIRGDCPMQ